MCFCTKRTDLLGIHASRKTLQSIRFFAGLAGACTVLLAGQIARELGGKRFAQALAALAVLFAGIFLAMDLYISMNAFEPLVWMGCAVILIRTIKTGNQKAWLWSGLIAGIGLENKYGIVFFAAGVVADLLLTQHRSMLLKPWVWLGGIIAFLIFLPNLIGIFNITSRFSSGSQTSASTAVTCRSLICSFSFRSHLLHEFAHQSAFFCYAICEESNIRL